MSSPKRSDSWTEKSHKSADEDGQEVSVMDERHGDHEEETCLTWNKGDVLTSGHPEHKHYYEGRGPRPCATHSAAHCLCITGCHSGRRQERKHKVLGSLFLLACFCFSANKTSTLDASPQFLRAKRENNQGGFLTTAREASHFLMPLRRMQKQLVGLTSENSL